MISNPSVNILMTVRRLGLEGAASDDIQLLMYTHGRGASIHYNCSHHIIGTLQWVGLSFVSGVCRICIQLYIMCTGISVIFMCICILCFYGIFQYHFMMDMYIQKCR